MSYDVREVEPGVYSLIVDGRSYEIRIEKDQCFWRGIEFSAEPPEPEVDRSRAKGDTVKISAPMPGKVVRVLVSPGEAVEAGQGVLVVEAMKMQNEMKAPRGGTVKTIRARAGATVAAGELLALIE